MHGLSGVILIWVIFGGESSLISVDFGRAACLCDVTLQSITRGTLPVWSRS